MNDKMKNSLKIPKRHTFKHYMYLLGQLYGEPKESLDKYIEEQLVKHDDNLDNAIECFDGLIKQAKFLQSNKVKK